MRSIVESKDKFKKAGLMPVGISVDAPEHAKLLGEALNVTFPLLSDQDLDVHRLFNVLNTLDSKTVALYEEYQLNIDKWSERDHHTIAVPSIFLIDENRTVRWAHAHRDHKTRPTVDQILTAIQSIL